MKAFVLFALVLSSMSPAKGAPPTVRHYRSSIEAFKGPDRTITWKVWQQTPEGDFRFREGDRYMGGQVWEHYLAFELHSVSPVAIKLSMIHLGSGDVAEDVVIRPGLRYAILKVTNGMMTAHKGAWSWTAQRVY